MQTFVAILIVTKISFLCVLNAAVGDIVPELGRLSALQTLSLRDNHFTGVVPPELGQLTALRHLFLNNNNLKGTFYVLYCSVSCPSAFWVMVSHPGFERVRGGTSGRLCAVSCVGGPVVVVLSRHTLSAEFWSWRSLSLHTSMC